MRARNARRVELPMLERGARDDLEGLSRNWIAALYLARAGVAELADAGDLKSPELKGSCGFDPHPRHHAFNDLRGGRVAQVGWGETSSVHLGVHLDPHSPVFLDALRSFDELSFRSNALTAR